MPYSSSFLPSGFEVIHLDNQFGSCDVSLYGGHLLSYIPKGQKEVIWLSPQAIFEPGKAIRGGCPICSPWFGPKTGDVQHGYARTALWKLDSIVETSASSTLKMICDSSLMTENGFYLELSISLGAKLKISLATSNISEDANLLTHALHTYVAIGSISKTVLDGLDSSSYIDKLDSAVVKKQVGSITIDCPVDRVYLSNAEVVVRDSLYQRNIHLTQEGGADTVVWNPWKGGSIAMSDVPDDGYQNFVCVEAANTTVPLEIKAKEKTILSQTIWVS